MTAMAYCIRNSITVSDCVLVLQHAADEACFSCYSSAYTVQPVSSAIAAGTKLSVNPKLSQLLYQLATIHTLTIFPSMRGGCHCCKYCTLQRNDYRKWYVQFFSVIFACCTQCINTLCFCITLYNVMLRSSVEAPYGVGMYISERAACQIHLMQHHPIPTSNEVGNSLLHYSLDLQSVCYT